MIYYSFCLQVIRDINLLLGSQLCSGVDKAQIITYDVDWYHVVRGVSIIVIIIVIDWVVVVIHVTINTLLTPEW